MREGVWAVCTLLCPSSATASVALPQPLRVQPSPQRGCAFSFLSVSLKQPSALLDCLSAIYYNQPFLDQGEILIH